MIDICVGLHKRVHKIGNEKLLGVLEELANIHRNIVHKRLPDGTNALVHFKFQLELEYLMVLPTKYYFVYIFKVPVLQS